MSGNVLVVAEHKDGGLKRVTLEMLGEGTRIAGNLGGHYPAEDIVAGAFEFESGVQAVGIWSFTTFEMFDKTEIMGTIGKINFSSFDTEPVVLTTNEGVTEFAIDNPPHVHQPLTQTTCSSATRRITAT